MVPLPRAEAIAEVEGEVLASGFRVSLSNFDGPFDLLLSLIGKRELDITDVALAAVTDEFVEYLKDLDGPEELEAASEFVVVAATLLDMKIVSLLPQGEFVDAEDVALLEARDLLFARLLQYRAFKEVSAWFSEGFERESKRHPRKVPLEARYHQHTPPLQWTTTLDDFHALALLALAPREIPVVGLEHLHAPLVSIREQAAHVIALLKGKGPVSFRSLITGVLEKGVVVARFLAVLELYREAAITFHQLEPLGELTLQWVADDFHEDALEHLGDEWGGEGRNDE